MTSPAPVPATFELIAERTHPFGKNAYMELARKRIVEGPEATEFLLLTRGYFTDEGSKRWTKFVTIPDDPELRAFLERAIREI